MAYTKTKLIKMKTFIFRSLSGALLLLLCACGGPDADPAPAPAPQRQHGRVDSAPTAADYQPLVQQIYVGYFGRPADPSGLAFWAEQWRAANAPLTLAETTQAYTSNSAVKRLVDFFGTSPESRELYAGDSASFITAIYRNLFNRDPDPDGLKFWSHFIDSGALSRPITALTIMSGAINGDITIVANKVAVASEFSAALNTPQLLQAYSGNAANVIARRMLAQVGASTSTATFRDQLQAARLALTTALNSSLLTTHLQVMTATPLAYSAPPPALTINDVLGNYRVLPDDGGGWSSGTITLSSATPGALVWTNKAGFSWSLTPDLAQGLLATDSRSPYFTYPGGQSFQLERSRDRVTGFTYVGNRYTRDGTLRPNNSTGISSYFNLNFDKTKVPDTFAYGFSLYTAIFPAVDQPLENFQIGYPGTWLNANNEDYPYSLVPAGFPFGNQYDPYARLFQTVEGSAGYWDSTRFPSTSPKYRINGTPNGYQNELSSPGWGFGSDALAAGAGSKLGLPMGSAGVAQLSNRLLMPPDGWTFKSGTAGEFLGIAWMALPLTEAKSGSTPVGDQSWTIFVNSANFQGPVAFYLPDVWTILSRSYPLANGRGLDARPATIAHFAMEYGHLPYFQAKDQQGNSYLRLPRLSYPTDGKGITYLASDFSLYSKAAIFQPLQDWLRGGAPISGKFASAGSLYPQMQADPVYMWEASSGIQIASGQGLNQYIAPIVVQHSSGASAWAFQWQGAALEGVFPEYYRKQGDYYAPLSAAEVPADTGLKTLDFPLDGTQHTLAASYESPASWGKPAAIAGPFSVTLTDGSTVRYSWYRFIDQPSLQGFDLSDAERARLQDVVERLHKNWAANKDFMAPPSIGNIATLDGALLVVPPKGLEIGYVPVVIRQSR